MKKVRSTQNLIFLLLLGELERKLVMEELTLELNWRDLLHFQYSLYQSKAMLMPKLK